MTSHGARKRHGEYQCSVQGKLNRCKALRCPACIPKTEGSLLANHLNSAEQYLACEYGLSKSDAAKEYGSVLTT